MYMQPPPEAELISHRLGMVAARTLWLFLGAVANLSTIAFTVAAAGFAKRLACMLSVWSVAAAANYFTLAALERIVPQASPAKASLLRLRLDVFAGTVPLSVITCGGFWLVCAWDRDLLYPSALGPMNSLANHAVHTVPGVMMALEWWYARCYRLGPPLLVPSLYILATICFRLYTGTWQYKLFSVLAPWGLAPAAGVFVALWCMF